MTTIIASTNRPDSYTLKIAEYYQKHLHEMGHEANILSLTDLPEGIIHPAMYEKQKLESFEILQSKITATDKFLFIIPEYNGSFPGILKVLIDACRFPESFYGKKAALVGVSTGKYGNIRGVDHFTGICHYMNLNVLPLKLHIPNIHKELNEAGEFFKEDTLKFTRQQMEQFILF
ncbi:NAD(P)H-dependent FMN reductase [Arcticibacter tournemirensis]|uniref:NAD(P)H-dependent oxidoreductase n=1 Tax=Arcticibacter tournemirensis TaxID=699437 RepID=A0A4Q0M2Y7_9SPHI|nr:NADPH-dependent FMN reductase [Arcticibacter tournemirensis]KAA8475873.1 NAD(P)H-dependent oxidoreductase [Arcticibacter tournemirensis]RXF67268.1 NADPH-dependent oxidoreductase [Arcticibacter tournemirensis]TQM52463.1 NAD(P)H-dependent FMN reductase [Arcticibacter tournemirensis]